MEVALWPPFEAALEADLAHHCEAVFDHPDLDFEAPNFHHCEAEYLEVELEA